MGRAVFIDIKEKELASYIFDFRGSTYEIREHKSFPISNQYDFSLEIETGQVEIAYVSLPAGWFNFRVIELPFSDKDKIRKTLPFELDSMILGGSDKVVFDAVVVGKSGDKIQVLAVYTEKDFLRKILEKLRFYAIDPVFVTCLELRKKLADFSLSGLLTPVLLDEEERIALAVEEMKKPVINVRRDELAYTRDIEKTRKSMRVTAAFLVLVALILSADVLLKIVSLRQEKAVLMNDIRKQYLEIFPGEKNIVNELYQLKSHMKELQEKEDIFIGLSPLKLLLALSQIERQGIVFNEITENKNAITLKGEAPSLSLIQQLKEKLGGILNDVTIADSKSSAQGNVLFTITAKGRKG
jgi:type II secretory pathway component PulL